MTSWEAKAFLCTSFADSCLLRAALAALAMTALHAAARIDNLGH
jgi:hypothetical protein